LVSVTGVDKSAKTADVAFCGKYDRATSATETWEGGGSSPFCLAATIGCAGDDDIEFGNVIGVPRRLSAYMAHVTELRVALTVDDFDEAVAFYRDALGLEQLADWSGDDGRVIILSAGRAMLELFDQAQAEKVDAIEAGRRVSGVVRLALEVADSVEAAQRLVAAGGEEVAPPVITPWGDRNARVQAPDGMQLTLFTTI
jgi:lactoylglutathione lyase